MNAASSGKGLILLLLTLAACRVDQITPAPAAAGLKRGNLLLVPTGQSYLEVDGWNSHTCGLRGDGVVECWGELDASYAPAVKVAAIGQFTQVAVGLGHSCALRSDGVIECWGSQSDGRAPAFRAAATGTFTRVSAGDGHTCGLRADGKIECWGYNEDGQAPALVEAQPTGYIFTHLSLGRLHSCAVRSDGAVNCWGRNSASQAPETRMPPSGRGYTQVAAGDLHTCALRDDGVVECWGDNILGYAPPTKVATQGKFTQISARRLHNCALRDDREIECWGWNDFGQAPAHRSTAAGFRHVGAGIAHGCAVRYDNAIECWGDNIWGQAPAIRISTMHVLPTATFSATPATVSTGQSFSLNMTGAAIPNYSGAVTFTYAFDCGDGQGYGPFSVTNSRTCSANAIGVAQVKGIVRDHDGDQAEYSASVTVTTASSGFLRPVDGPPVLNVVKAGAAVPLNFSLGGDQGLSILAAGYPRSEQVSCDATSTGNLVEETVTAGSSGLTYSATTGLYTYVWKTDKGWANTCRKLTLRLFDGREHVALFRFSR